MKKLKMMVKGLMIICTSFFLVYSSAYADTPDSALITNQIIDNSLSEESILEQIISENPDVDPKAITILDIQQETPYLQISNEEILPKDELSSRAIVLPIRLFQLSSKQVQYSNRVGKDAFIISVARGQTVTLGASFSTSLGAQVSGSVGIFELGLNRSVDFGLSASTAFSGPSAAQAQSYNSREFRIKIYERGGTYSGRWYWSTNPRQTISYASGSWSEPTGYVQYSIDRYY